MRRLLAVALGLLFLPHSVRAQEGKHPLTPVDLWKVKRVGAPAISPDGRWVVVEATDWNLDENKSSSDLWLLAADGKSQRRLTTFPGKDGGAAWSPDGKTIAFTSKRGGDVAQVHLIDPEGGEARPLTDMPMAPSGLKWGRDGKTLYCVAWTWPDTPDDAAYKKKAAARKKEKAKAFVIDAALYRYWDDWLTDGKRPVVFAVDIATGKHRNLFAHTPLHLPVWGANAGAYDVSPDGKEICFTADSIKEPGTDFNHDLYAMATTKAEKPRNLTADNPAEDGSPRYSPDGTRIAFLRQTVKHFYADRERIMVLDRKTGKSLEVTAKLDRSCADPAWLGKGDRILCEVEDAGYHALGLVDPSGKEPVKLIREGEDSFSAPSADASGKTIAFLRSSFDRPAQVWVGRDTGKGMKYQAIESFNDALVSSWKLGKVENLTFKGADGDDVQMWVVYPPNFDPKKKWPLLHMVHGGPHNGVTSGFHFRWNPHVYAAWGYVVPIVNFHGSSGFGQKFCDSITGDMGTKPLIDILKATDLMEQKPFIDKKRLAAAGGSYGGYMVAWMNGHTDRFQAYICHAGVYNWHSMMASDVVASRERRLGALPWKDMEKIDGQSAQRFAGNFKTPTLVIHGEKDYRVPVTQGLEYFMTLRLKGVPTRLVYFPEENHWVLSPANALLWHREFKGWLDRYCPGGVK